MFGVGQPHVAGLPAIRTIIHSVHSQMNIVLRLAEAAELLARALRFRLVALRAERNHGWRLSWTLTVSVRPI